MVQWQLLLIQYNANRNIKKNKKNNQADHFRPRSCSFLYICPPLPIHPDQEQYKEEEKCDMKITLFTWKSYENFVMLLSGIHCCNM